MAAPVLQAEGTIAAVTSGGVTPTNPAHQADDILVAAAMGWVPNSAASPVAAIAAPSGWTKITEAGLGTVGDETGWIAWFWKRAASGSETNPTFDRPAGWDTGVDSCYAARVWCIRGCATTGDPWDEAEASAVHTGTNGAVAAITVSGSERLVIHFAISSDDNSMSAPTGWTNGTSSGSITGTDANSQTFRKDNQSSSTSADASSSGAPAAGGYAFLGVSFKPAGGSPQTVSGAGNIGTAQAFGTAKINQQASPSGIGTAQAFGAARLNLQIRPAGLASAEAFGTATITGGAVVFAPKEQPTRIRINRAGAAVAIMSR